MLFLLLCSICFSVLPSAGSGPPGSPQISIVRQLYDQGNWQEIVRLIPAASNGAAELDLYRGLALAKLERWPEARAAFTAGARKDPSDKRFFLELAGVAFRTNDLGAAEANLNRALHLDPRDSYALNFLATIYFLRGNLEAALEYWNRISQPRINEVKMPPRPRVREELLDKAVVFSPLSTLRLKDFETTQARLDNLGVFSFYKWDLQPKNQDSYDIAFHSAERSGWGGNKWLAALSTLRGLPYETVYPAYYDWGHAAVNVSSLLRWDSQKRRAFASVSTPLERDTRWRLQVHLDARDENWDVSDTFRGSALPLSNMKLRKIEAGAEIRSVENGRWSWETGVSFARRTFGNVAAVDPSAEKFFTNGDSLESTVASNYRVIFLPAKRITVDSSVSAALGRFFAAPLGVNGRTEGALDFHWFPRAEGDDYEMESRLRAGGGFGGVPFDEFFTLGVERDDNDLWMRGISATHGGRKGNSPLGRDYILWNWSVDKVVYNGTFVKLKVGPLFDAGRISDPSGFFGSRGWLYDPGAELRVRILDTVEVVLSYGRDIRSGQNVFFGAALP